MLFLYSLKLFCTQIIDQAKEGNLALPTSQQPGPLFCFGQNIIDKNDLQFFLSTDYVKGKATKFTEFTPALLYGINDKFSLFITLPIMHHLTVNNKKLSGLENITLQLEYGIFEKDKKYATHQATLVANILLPVNTHINNPLTNNGTPSFFLGFTASHLAIKWYVYTSCGITFPLPRHHIKQKNQYLYQYGVGRNLGNLPGWIFTGMIEFFGFYSPGNKITNNLTKNMRGNIFFIGPSLWISSKRLILQAGISFVAAQSLCKNNKYDYDASFNIGWKF